ncbi:MAG: protein kinase [Candidatus Binatia bacterium]
MQCPQCRRANPDDAKFCLQCGACMALTCGTCDTELPADAKFCLRCGAAVEPRAPTTTPPPSPGPALPAAFANGRYTVRRFLGEGARKRVYLACDTRLDRNVAIALIKTEGLDETGATRVRREAQAMGRLGSHPHIVTIHDIGDEHGQPYVVQELMDGGSLSDLIRAAPESRLEISTALRIGGEIASALSFAHQHGVVHRDVKPGNVWLTTGGRAKLGDFGLAVAPDRTRLTQAGVMLGTAAYMPPEQALGGDVAGRADLYSLGAMLYETLTGRPPFPGNDTVSVISQHLNTPPLPPALLNPQVPQALDTLVLRLLAKSPEDRPGSADEVTAMLASIAAAPLPSAPVTLAETVRARARTTAVRNPFVGREKELSQLKDRMEDAIAGHGLLMMLVGEPGIGKTRLSEELAVHARLRGAQVLLGQCYESEGAPPYVPFMEALRQYVSSRSNDDLRREIGDAGSDLAKLVSEIRARIPDLPPSAAREPEAERYRLLEAVSSFLVNASQPTAMLLILDDLHWADKPTLLLLQHLARRLGGSRMLVVGTYRDVELDRRHPLADILGQLRRERLYERVLLRGLDLAGVHAFIAARAGLTASTQQNIPQAFAQTIHEQTEGNPFFIEETILHLVDTGAVYVQDGRWVGDPASIADNIPEGVREVLGRRLSRLSETTNRALTFASVLGREFDFDVLLALTEIDEGTLLSSLEEALAAQLIAEHRGSSGPAYRFTHALVQETLYGELSLGRKQRVHLRAGRALEQARATHLDALVGQLAHHYYQGNETTKAIDYSRRAGNAAVRIYGWEEAIRHWQNALELMQESAGNEAERAALMEALGDLTFVTGIDYEKGIGFLEQALAAYERLGVPGKVAGVHSRLGRGMVSFGGKLDLKRGAAHLDAARTILEQDAPGSAALAYVYTGLCTLYFWTLENERGLACARRALEIGEQLHSRPVTALALTFLGSGYGRAGEFRRAGEFFERAYQIADKDNLTFIAFMATTFHAEIHFFRRDPATAKALLQRELDKPRLASASIMRSMSAGLLGATHILAGEMQAARQVREGGNDFVPFLRRLDFVDGRWEAAEQRMLSQNREGQQLGSVNYSRVAEDELGDLCLRRGEYSRAEEYLRACVEIDEREQIPAMGGMDHRVVLAQVLAKTGRIEEARRHLDFCTRRLARGEDWGGVAGRVALARAVVLSADGQWDEATQALDEALAIARRYGVPWDEADALHERARLQLARQEQDARGRTEALGFLDQAITIYQRLGAKKHLELAMADKVGAQGLDSADSQTSIDIVAAEVRREQPDLHSHAAPDGTVTIMFSDMEGFTAMTERLGDLRAREVVRDHNRIVRQQLAAHGGYEVELQGDGFLLAFGSARRALLCAIALQRAFAAYSARHADEPIRVRVGLHTGEALRDADKFFGKTVILAARVAAQAKGGEILVSSLFKELTESTGDIRFGDGRLAELKGIAEPQRIFAVHWQPPGASAESRHHG